MASYTIQRLCRPEALRVEAGNLPGAPRAPCCSWLRPGEKRLPLYYQQQIYVYLAKNLLLLLDFSSHIFIKRLRSELHQSGSFAVKLHTHRFVISKFCHTDDDPRCRLFRSSILLSAVIYE